jgi:hypothetical protein
LEKQTDIAVARYQAKLRAVGVFKTQVEIREECRECNRQKRAALQPHLVLARPKLSEEQQAAIDHAWNG